MKYILAALGGFALTLFTFAGGVALAISYLSADPVPLDSANPNRVVDYPSEIVRVDLASQDYERVGTVPVKPATPSMSDAHSPDVDEVTTAALPASDSLQMLSNEHVAWCSSRYRSYQMEDNSYRPYSGGRRECFSPYYDGSDTAEEEGAYLEASALGVGYDRDVTSEFVASCMARYRSYNVADNTYQPFGGGARVQCQ
jgi:hypothetical protein